MPVPLDIHRRRQAVRRHVGIGRQHNQRGAVRDLRAVGNSQQPAHIAVSGGAARPRFPVVHEPLARLRQRIAPRGGVVAGGNARQIVQENLLRQAIPAHKLVRQPTEQPGERVRYPFAFLLLQGGEAENVAADGGIHGFHQLPAYHDAEIGIAARILVMAASSATEPEAHAASYRAAGTP